MTNWPPVTDVESLIVVGSFSLSIMGPPRRDLPGAILNPTRVRVGGDCCDFNTEAVPTKLAPFRIVRRLVIMVTPLKGLTLSHAVT